MTVTFASRFALWSSCDYIQPTWINQDNIPILRSIMESYLQTPFCPARWHGIEIWLSLEGHYSAYHRVIDKAAFVFISIMWFTPHPLFLTVFFSCLWCSQFECYMYTLCMCVLYLSCFTLSKLLGSVVWDPSQIEKFSSMIFQIFFLPTLSLFLLRFWWHVC